MSTSVSGPRADTTLPLVSIITPTYNRADLLPETIESLLAQDHPRLEILVLDDGSTDETPALLQQYAAREGARLRWSRHDNMGQAQTVTRGFAMAQGNLIGIVSSDDPQPPGLVGPLVACLMEAPDVGLPGLGDHRPRRQLRSEPANGRL